MKPWIKRSLFGVLGASVLAGGLVACGHGGYRGHGGWGSAMTPEQQAEFRVKMIDRVASKLDLTAEQKQKLTVVADKMAEQRKALMGSTTDPRAELQALVAGPKFDVAKAQALITDKTTALQSKSPEVLAAFADFYDSLKPEQQQKVRDFMAKRQGGGWLGRH